MPLMCLVRAEQQAWSLAEAGSDRYRQSSAMQGQETSPSSKDTQSHLLKVRQLIIPEMMANEPDQDQTEVFLAAAERGESAKVRKVRDSVYACHLPLGLCNFAASRIPAGAQHSWLAV